MEQSPTWDFIFFNGALFLQFSMSDGNINDHFEASVILSSFWNAFIKFRWRCYEIFIGAARPPVPTALCAQLLIEAAVRNLKLWHGLIWHGHLSFNKESHPYKG